MKFEYIVTGSWSASTENMRFIQKKGKYFIFELNGLVAASAQEKKEGHFIRIDWMGIPGGTGIGFEISGNSL
jgi:hypothetical protein